MRVQLAVERRQRELLLSVGRAVQALNAQRETRCVEQGQFDQHYEPIWEHVLLWLPGHNIRGDAE